MPFLPEETVILGFFCVVFWLELPKMLSILFEILNRFLNKKDYASDMLWFLLKY